VSHDELNRVRAAYDEVASEYAARISDELAGKPLDRALLDVIAERVGSGPRVCDAGCGPGHVARYLRDRGVDVFGLDLSPAMVAEAARRHPDIDFRVGDLTRFVDVPPDLAGVVAYYSLIHLPRERVTDALTTMRGHLRAGGFVFVAFHVGSEGLHLDEWWGRAVSLDFTFFEVDEMKAYLTDAGYEIEWVVERLPSPPPRGARARAPHGPFPLPVKCGIPPAVRPD
jgi:SAM-dependent methyltransferase